ncbi:hypothetical protein L798_11545 [Zootermopsis nevadensis]|uniref:Uncharacterized protein n=1 Tax=Zootermopsis nevadensis TaxID=136037 RepID=A0A067RUW9_ZOONE|nr:hypothetical protein L798_11545 [Zootermopsis nevadensis]
MPDKLYTSFCVAMGYSNVTNVFRLQILYYECEMFRHPLSGKGTPPRLCRQVKLPMCIFVSSRNKHELHTQDSFLKKPVSKFSSFHRNRRFHNIPSQINPIYTLHPCLSKTHFNIILSSMPGRPSCLLPLGFPIKIF